MLVSVPIGFANTVRRRALAFSQYARRIYYKSDKLKNDSGNLKRP